MPSPRRGHLACSGRVRHRLAILLTLVALVSVAAGQPDWEMRVCADPDNPPISDGLERGYENRIGRIIADELGAELSYLWVRIDRYAVRDFLLTGECDLILGVAEGAAGLLNTIAYSRMPFVFVSRADSGIEIASLDDPRLYELRIGAFRAGLPAVALDVYGHSGNVTLLQPDRTARGALSAAPIVRAVIKGEFDIGIVFAPDASYFAQQEPGLLHIVPVSPEIVPPLLQMFQITTIGVRPGDESLRDLLNGALAGRWDDIQGVYVEFGLPVQYLPRPSLTREVGR